MPETNQTDRFRQLKTFYLQLFTNSTLLIFNTSSQFQHKCSHNTMSIGLKFLNPPFLLEIGKRNWSLSRHIQHYTSLCTSERRWGWDWADMFWFASILLGVPWTQAVWQPWSWLQHLAPDRDPVTLLQWQNLERTNTFVMRAVPNPPR